MHALCVLDMPLCRLSSCFLLLSSVFLGVELFSGMTLSSWFSLFNFEFLVVENSFWFSFCVIVVDDLVFVSAVSCSVGSDSVDQICNSKQYNISD
jgi:hypothetical protein